MNGLKDMEKDIRAVLEGGDILLIVPPFGVRDFAILGPHILQAAAEDSGFKTEILYLNILLASLMGEDRYDSISGYPYDQRRLNLGERLFARSAHGLEPMGKSPGPVADRFKAIDWQELLQIENICFEFIEEVVPVICSLDYKMVGCTSALEQTNAGVALLKGIKRQCPGVLTLMGGKNCEGEMAEGVLSLTPAIDYIFSGESEISFQEFLKSYRAGKRPGERILWGEPLLDLDSLPLPRYDSFFKQMARFGEGNLAKQRVITYETSRGCWWGQKKKCSFCGNNNRRDTGFRQKSAEKVMADLEYIRDNYDVTGILMTDNIVPHSYYDKLLPILSRDKQFPPIWYQENANLGLKELMRLKEARIKSALAGIESLSTGLLKLMNKRSNARQNLLLLRNAMSVGIYLQWHMLWGFPNDKAEYYRETLALLPLIRHFQPPRELLHLILVRFSPYVEDPENHRIVDLRPLETYGHIFPGSADIGKLAYQFSGRYPGESHDHPGLIRELEEEIAVWQSSWEKANLTMTVCEDYYIIRDSRQPGGEARSHVLEYEAAKAVMRCCKADGSEEQKWALEQGLGVIADSWYVPLVVARPELLLEFES